MRRIPKQVDVIGYLIPVEQQSQAAVTRAMKGMAIEPTMLYKGYLDPHKRIVICRDLTLREKWEILIHEIGHEVEFIIADLGLGNCDISIESIHTIYHRLLTGVLFTNGIIA